MAGWNTTLNTNLMFSTRARRSVENSRLLLDAAKTRAKGGMFKLPGKPDQQHHEEVETSEEAKAEIEQAEDEFVGQTEEAVGVMKNVSVDCCFAILNANLPSRSSTLQSHSATSQT